MIAQAVACIHIFTFSSDADTFEVLLLHFQILRVIKKVLL